VDETKRAWDEVGEGFIKLGRLISEHYQDLGEEQPPRPDADETGAVAGAIQRATDELDRAFTSLGDTLRDDEARQHVRDTSRKLSDALKVTLTTVGEEVRGAVDSRRAPRQEDPDPPWPTGDSGSSAA